MPIQLKEENGAKLLAVQVSGKLSKAGYEHSVPEFPLPEISCDNIGFRRTHARN